MAGAWRAKELVALRLAPVRLFKADCGKILAFPLSFGHHGVRKKVARHLSGGTVMTPIQFSCPRCRSVLSTKRAKVGEKVACPKCQQNLIVPHAPVPILPASGTAVAALVPGASPPRADLPETELHVGSPPPVPVLVPAPPPLPPVSPVRHPVPRRYLVAGGIALAVIALVVVLLARNSRNGRDGASGSKPSSPGGASSPHEGDPRDGPEAILAKYIRDNLADPDQSAIQWVKWGPTTTIATMRPLLKEEYFNIRDVTHFVRLRYRFRERGAWRIQDYVYAVGPKVCFPVKYGSDEWYEEWKRKATRP